MCANLGLFLLRCASSVIQGEEKEQPALQYRYLKLDYELGVDQRVPERKHAQNRDELNLLPKKQGCCGRPLQQLRRPHRHKRQERAAKTLSPTNETYSAYYLPALRSLQQHTELNRHYAGLQDRVKKKINA